MKEFVNGTSSQFDTMYRQLTSSPKQTRRYSGVKLSALCDPRECCLDVVCHDDGSFSMSLAPRVTYSGSSDEAIESFLRDGFTGDFEDLKTMLRQTLKPLSSEYASDPDEQSNSERKPNGSNSDLSNLGSGFRRPNIEDIPEDQGTLNEKKEPPTSDEILEKLSERIVGQTDNIRKLSELVAIHLSKVDPRLPLSVFLAGGPGTGKTYTAESLNTVLNELGYNFVFVKVNLGEYQDAVSVNRLVGGSPNYVGYGDPTAFDPLIGNEYAVVLFDEAEKPHRNVLDMLLNIMDKGEIQLACRSGGRSSISFRKAILVFTSNMPVPVGEVRDKDIEEVNSTIKKVMAETSYFRPEFVSRMTFCSFYDAPSRKEQIEMTAACMNAVAQEYGLTVDSVDYNTLHSFVDNYGYFEARKLKHCLGNKYGQAFSRAYRAGQRHIKVHTGQNGEIIILPSDPAPSDSISHTG